MQLPVLWPVSVSTRTLTNQGIGFLETLETKLIYLKIILITPGIIWSLKFKTKKEWWNCGITNTNIKQNCYESRYLFCCNYEQSSRNNQCTWCSLLNYGRIFSKKSFSWGDKNIFGQKYYGEVVLNWRANDQIIQRFGRSFINDKCICQ